MNVRIGVSCGTSSSPRAELFHLDIRYSKSLLASGALPLILPIVHNHALVDRLLDQVDGLLLSGGVDISPHLYGEHLLKPSYQYDKKRDQFDLLLYRAARKRKMPVFGICRGFQLINVAEGGTLYQDIPTQVKTSIHHQSTSEQDMEHLIQVNRSSELFQILKKDEVMVNSIHHQAIKELARTLRASAVAPDGIIEAFEGKEGGWLMGVQFHPERLTEQEEFRELIEYFVDVARREK
ncbi:MAG: gamma-glutamyl-gamma-aminobutyrate hydrolase family protein [Tissierellia bacterium]|nr:gamma-glutamyl-gamma-aminobutyrate hydrolase family protein [Tissierellia bacterium]